VAAEHGLDIVGGKVRRTSSRFCLGVEHGDYNGTELFGVGTDRFIWLACAPQRPLPPPPLPHPQESRPSSALPPRSRPPLTPRALPHRQAERDGHDQPLQRQLPRRRRRQLQGRRRRCPRAAVGGGGGAGLGAVPLRRGLRDGGERPGPDRGLRRRDRRQHPGRRHVPLRLALHQPHPHGPRSLRLGAGGGVRHHQLLAGGGERLHRLAVRSARPDHDLLRQGRHGHPLQPG